MLNPSYTYLNSYKTPARQVTGRVTYTLDGSDYVIRPDGTLSSMKIEKSSPQGKLFGFAVSQKITVEVLGELELPKGTRLIPEIFIKDSEDIVELPYFYVDAVNHDKVSNKTTIVAYDIIYNPNNYLIKDIEFTYPVALSAYAEKVVQKLGGTMIYYGVEYDITEAPNFNGNESLHSVLASIAEASGTIAYVQSEDVIRFRMLPTGVASDTLSPTHYFELTTGKTYEITQLISSTELGDNISYGEDGYAQVLRDNPFLVLREDIVDLLELIGTLTIGRHGTTYSVTWRGCPAYEIGDLIALKDKNGNSVKVHYLDETLTYNGGLRATSSWTAMEQENPEANPSSIGEIMKNTYAKVDKVNQQISMVVESNQEMEKKVAMIEITTNDIEAKVENIDMNAIGSLQNEMSVIRLESDLISQEVSRIDQFTNDSINVMNDNYTTIASRVSNTVTPDQVQILIQEEFSQGVESVTTQTGFTFDNEGLTVSKGGSEIATQITEDGMTVTRSGREMLVADHIGVTATNLKASTYLTIGNSRFEAYEADDLSIRTGCFWLD